MRVLTGPTIAAADSDSSRPYCLLQVDFPAPVGVKWYAQEDFGRGDGTSWDNAQGRVLEWGQVRVEIKADSAVNAVGECTIKLRDEDKALWGYFQQVEPQRSWVTLYQQFRGNAAADLVTLHVGIVNAPCAWSEKEHAVTLDVTDISTYFDRTVGNFADRLDYPRRGPDRRGQDAAHGLRPRQARARGRDEFRPGDRAGAPGRLLRQPALGERRGEVPAGHAVRDLDRRRAHVGHVRRQQLPRQRARRLNPHRDRDRARRGPAALRGFRARAARTTATPAFYPGRHHAGRRTRSGSSSAATTPPRTPRLRPGQRLPLQRTRSRSIRAGSATRSPTPARSYQLPIGASTRSSRTRHARRRREGLSRAFKLHVRHQ